MEVLTLAASQVADAVPDQSVLVLAPHPDDESFGCGGAIALLTQAGVPVDVVFMTRGERGAETPGVMSPEAKHELAVLRSEEARQACAILGVRQIMFLEGTDGNLSLESHHSQALGNLLRRHGYRRVFCPWPQECHEDHAATFQWLKNALRDFGGNPELWLYEVWTPLIPNMIIPIDDVMETKRRAMQAHRSQLRLLDYERAFQGLAAFRGLACPPSKLAEAFVITSSADLRS